MTHDILSGWAVTATSGRGVDPEVRAPGPGLIGRRVHAYIEGRGFCIIPAVDQCWRAGGAWLVRTIAGHEYALGEPIWSQIKGAAQVGSER